MYTLFSYHKSQSAHNSINTTTRQAFIKLATLG